MKNKVLIILLLFILCGCSCEYNLKIGIDNYGEKLIISTPDSEESKYLTSEDWLVAINFDEYNEEKELIEKDENGKYYNVDSDNNSVTFSYLHDIKTLKYSTAALRCFDKVTIYKNQNNFYISTSNYFKCFDEYPTLDNVKVVIEADGIVLSSNSDDIEDNKYVWYLNRNNVNRKINITIDTNGEQPSNVSSNENSSSITSVKKSYSYYIFILILFIVFVVGYLTYKYLKKQSDNNNKI